MDSGSNERYHWIPKTVEDKENKLIWQRREAGKKNYVGAQSFCEELQLAGVSDWRLPMMSELRELNRQITSDSTVYKEIFNQPMDSFFWSGSLTGMGTRVWTINLWTGKAGRIDPKGDRRTTMCVRSSENNWTATYSNNSIKTKNGNVEIKQSFEKGMSYFSYNKIVDSSSEVIGCGFFHVGCLEESLTFPNFQTGFHIKGFRRVNLWGKDRPWTDTGLQVEKGDRIYFYGTGEVTTCSHSSCSKRGPQNLGNGSISYTIGRIKTPRSLRSFQTFQPGGEAYQTSLSITFGGILNLTVRDWSKYPPPSNYYGDNSGAYVLDIFVIDPDQQEGFNLFRDALFAANPDDENVRAYLGKR
jgi:hypothetical protein